MVMPTFTMRQLLEAGVHFGHHTRRWNPKMAPYIFGVRNNTHIIDLEQTVPLLHRALDAVRQTVAGNGRVLFVGTKRQAAEKIRDAAKRCGQYYVDHRWLGGMLTNWKTISQSIKRLKQMDEQLSGDTSGFTKKELLNLTRDRDKLERALGGIRDMGGLPDILFIIDTNKESIAVQEAVKLNIPTVAVIDTNSDPEGVTFPVPGNDDALRAIELYCDLVSQSVLEGIQAELMASGADIGESEDPQPEEAVEAAEGEAAEGASADGEAAAEQSGEEAATEEAATEEATTEEAATEEAAPEDAAADAKTEAETKTENADDGATPEEEPAKDSAA